MDGIFDSDDDIPMPKPTKKGRVSKEYMPKPGSGGYAILLALHNRQSQDPGYVGYMTKSELIEAAEPLANESMKFSRVGPDQWYTGWSSSSLLEKKGLIEMWSNPKKIKLTEKGHNLALKLKDAKAQASLEFPETSSVSRKSPSETRPTPSTFVIKCLPSEWNVSKVKMEEERGNHVSQSSTAQLTLCPGEFKVVLVVDAMEITGGGAGGKVSRKNITLEELQRLNVPYESRKLSIGDFVWIAKGQKGELVLPFVVERKRLDDLRSSIMDGRYKEQKQRLSRCGLPRKMYLVEETASRGGKEAWGSRALDRNVLEQALSNTCIRDQFTVKRCRTQKETVQFLAALTDTLTDAYSGKTLRSRSRVEGNDEMSLLTFIDFQNFSRPDKPLTVREIFCNMLIQMKGLSPGMAWSITHHYPTPLALKRAFRESNQQETMLAGLIYDDGKKIPGAVSKAMSWLFNDPQLN